MKIKDIVNSARLDEYSQRKYSKLTMIFMTLAIIIFVGVNSIVGSMKESTQGLLQAPMGRILCFTDNEKRINEIYHKIKENYKDSKMVNDIFHSAQDYQVIWKESDKWIFKENETVQFQSYFDNLKNYLYDGEKREPEYGEVILPKYLYGVGAYDEYNYFDTKELVGKQLTFVYEGESENITYTLTVIGTYNNVLSSCKTLFLMNDEQYEQWYQLGNKVTQDVIDKNKELYQNDTEIQKIIEDGYEGDADAFWLDTLTQQHIISVSINPEVDIEKAQADILEKTGEKGIPYLVLDLGLISYFDFIIYVGNLITIFLLITAFVNIMIMVSVEVRRRKGEFALKQAVGYTKRDICIVLATGKLCVLVKAFVIAIICITFLLFSGNYIIQNVFPFYLRHITLAFDWNVVFLAAIGVAVGTILGMFVAIPMINKINIVEVLKKES